MCINRCRTLKNSIFGYNKGISSEFIEEKSQNGELDVLDFIREKSAQKCRFHNPSTCFCVLCTATFNALMLCIEGSNKLTSLKLVCH